MGGSDQLREGGGGGGGTAILDPKILTLRQGDQPELQNVKVMADIPL